MNKFMLGLGLGLVLVSCGSTGYTYYVLKYREGKLNARNPKDDLPISICDDTARSKANCYVILRDEKIKIERDIIELRERLKACEE